MCKQKGINDYNKHDAQLRGHYHQEGYGCEKRNDDKEVDYQASCFSIAVT